MSTHNKAGELKMGRGRERFGEIRRHAVLAAAAVLVGLLLCACGEEAQTAEYVYVPEEVPGGTFPEGTFQTMCNFKAEGAYLYYLNDGIYRIPLEKLDFNEKELWASREDLLEHEQERVLCYTVDQGKNLYYCAGSWQNMTVALYKRAADGTIVYRIPLETWENIPTVCNKPMLATDGEENLYVLDRNALLRFDPEGNLTGELSVQKEMPDGQSFQACLLEGKEGRVYFVIDNQMDGSRAAYEILKGGTPRLEELEEAFGQGLSGLYEGLDGPLIGGNDDWLYQYHPETGSREKLLRWQDCDVFRSDIQALIQVSEERILVLLSEIASSTVRQNLLLLTRIPADEAARKEQVTLACLAPSGDLEKAVAQFNQTSGRYHVTIERYQEDDNGGRARIDSALASGEASPDLLDLTNMDIVKYAEAGTLEDLSQYMEAGEIRKEDYLSNLLEGYTLNGKLVCIPKSFRFLGLYVTDERLPEGGDWTMESVMEAADQYSDMRLFPDQWGYSVLGQFSGGYILEKFVDWESGECSFDGEEFCSLLEWVRRQNSEGGADRESMITPRYIEGYSGYQEDLMSFGGNAVLRGAPLADGKEMFFILAENALGIPVNAGNKEGAWTFLQFYLQNQEADGSLSGFPTSIAMLDQMEEKAVTPLYVMTEEGIYLDENGEPKETPRRILYRDGMEIEVYALSQDDADALREVLERIDFRPWSGLEQAVMAIVEEEAGAFFDGAKTAAEAADIIQNRVRILIHESR